jgi:hypothetical protein
MQKALVTVITNALSVTRLLNKIAQLFEKSSLNSWWPKNFQNIYIKAHFENLKNLHQTSF